MLVIALRLENTILDVFYSGSLLHDVINMTSSNDDVMYLRAYYVILTTRKNQEMVVAYSV